MNFSDNDKFWITWGFTLQLINYFIFRNIYFNFVVIFGATIIMLTLINYLILSDFRFYNEIPQKCEIFKQKVYEKILKWLKNGNN